MAAPLSMAGPPTSMSSTPGLLENGYRLTTTRSNGSIPFSASVATSSSRSRLARMPACTRGWRVFTRPPSICGTSIEYGSSPSSRRYTSVDPPVVTRSTPRSARPRAKTSRPALSYVEISARRALSPPSAATGARPPAPSPGASRRCRLHGRDLFRGDDRDRCRSLRRRSGRSRPSPERLPRGRPRSDGRRGTREAARSGYYDPA